VRKVDRNRGWAECSYHNSKHKPNKRDFRMLVNNRFVDYVNLIICMYLSPACTRLPPNLGYISQSLETGDAIFLSSHNAPSRSHKEIGF
jgi:hypothetical protein